MWPTRKRSTAGSENLKNEGPHYRVYAFSRRKRIPEGFTTRDMAEDVVHAMDTLGIRLAKNKQYRAFMTDMGKRIYSDAYFKKRDGNDGQFAACWRKRVAHGEGLTYGMFVEDEKDYIMRMIKQVIRALFSIILGKEYTTVEMPQKNKYEVSGKAMDEYLKMIDDGMINEAENDILQDVNYSNKQDIVALAQFYEYIGDKDEAFLEEHDYSRAEVLDGLKRVAEKSGYGSIVNHFVD